MKEKEGEQVVSQAELHPIPFCALNQTHTKMSLPYICCVIDDDAEDFCCLLYICG